MSGIEALSETEKENVKNFLRTLIHSLKDKKASGYSIPDEDFIVQSLTQPERGDVKVILLRNQSEIEIFLANRRDEESPFSIMNSEGVRKHPERKFIDGVRSQLPPGHCGLFIISQQDREMLKSPDKIEIYSSFFNLDDSLKTGIDPYKDLKSKKLTDCTRDEMWIIYKKKWDMDNRWNEIEKDLFSFSVVYAKYNQKYKEEILILTPDNYKQKIGQLIRDIYPYNVRVNLRKEFIKDHKTNLGEVQKALNTLLSSLESKLSADDHDDFGIFVNSMKEFVRNIMQNDPELNQFV